MLTDYRKYKLNKREMMALGTGLFLAMGFLGYVFYGSLLVAGASLLLYLPAKRKLEGILGERRRKKLRLQFRDFLYSLSASFASGRHMREAMEEARYALSSMYSGEDLIMKELDQMLDQIHYGGRSDAELIRDLAARSGLEDARDFARVYLAARETGGNLVAAMNQTARIIGEKITIENEIQTMILQKKTEGRLITAMPILVILFLRTMSPEYISVLYHTLAGRILMSLALLGMGAAYIMIERITDIDV